VGPNQEEIVTQIAKMRHSAIAGRRVAHGGGDIEARQTSPSEPNGKHRIKVKSPSSSTAGEDLQCWSDGIEAKSKERILSATPERFYMGEKAPDPATFHPLGGGVRPELRDSAQKGLWVFGRNFEKGPNHLGGMLTISVHHKRVGEALLMSETERVEDSGPLARVLIEAEDAQSLQTERLRL